MKILYIYRHPDMGYSIGKVFRPIEEEMRNYAEVDSVYLPVPNYSARGLYLNVRAAREAVKRKRYDIVHITGAEHYLIPFLRGQKVVVTVHDLGFCTILRHKISYRIKYALFVKSLRKASFVTFISKKTEAETLERVRLRAGRYATVNNAVGREFTESPKAFDASCPVILHIGTKEHKNLDRSIEALAGISCRLRIIGRISSKQEQRLEELGIKYTVAENLTDAELLDEYRKADIVNFPSVYEGFGMPIIEAQAVGRLVVTSALEPMMSVAGEGGALFVDPYSVESIRQAYITAVNDGKARSEIIAKGSDNVKRFDVKNIAYTYYNKYLSILPPPPNNL